MVVRLIPVLGQTKHCVMGEEKELFPEVDAPTWNLNAVVKQLEGRKMELMTTAARR